MCTQLYLAFTSKNTCAGEIGSQGVTQRMEVGAVALISPWRAPWSVGAGIGVHPGPHLKSKGEILVFYHDGHSARSK